MKNKAILLLLIKNILVFILPLLVLYSCEDSKRENSSGNNSKGFIIQKGFILEAEQHFTGKRFWFFVEAKKIDNENWLRDFRTENLKGGFEFNRMSQSNFPDQLSHEYFDTISVKTQDNGNLGLVGLRLAPVKIKYSLDAKFRDKKTNLELVQYVGNRQVRFGFNSLPVDIQNIVPLAKPE